MLKAKFIKEPILTNFDLNKKIVIKIDILDYLIKACLSQLDN